MATKTHKRKSNGRATTGSKSRTLLTRTKRITRAAHDAQEKFVEVEQNVEKYAKAHPWRTMGLSVITGMLVGRILNNRR